MDSYGGDFEFFLQHTTEKNVLFREIKKEIEKHPVQSLLDIGAGEGSLSIPLSKAVNEYLAVEMKPEFAQKLQKAGVTVIESEIQKATISNQFDTVLMSHSLYFREDYRGFTEKAWSLVKPGGYS